MAKTQGNKETGVEKTPGLAEVKGLDSKPETTEITPELVADLKARIKDFEGYVPSLIKEIEVQKEAIEISLKENSRLEDSIKEKDGVIEEQKNKIAQLNKSIVDFGALYSKEKELELSKEGEVVIRFLLSPAGRFKLPFNVGQEVSLHKEVAAEIVESAYAEYVVEEE